MLKKLFSIIIILLFVFPSSYEAFALSDSSELNWYYVQREKNEIPEGPKECSSFLKECDGYYLGDTSSKVLYLTFDEGYEKGYTNDILDTLKELNIPAAFFVVKPYIDKEPEIIKRMADEGHLVCNHSNHHPSMPAVTDINKFNKEIQDVEKSYKDLTGQDMPKFFRPPMGKYSKESLERTKALGYKTIFWSFAYKDWLIDKQPSKDYAVKKILSGVHPGGILLLHAVSKTNTEILKAVLTELQTQGYEFKSLTEL